MTITDTIEHMAAERDLLRLLCSILVKPVTRVELCRLIDPEKFIDNTQRIVFEEIRALGAVDAKRLLEVLPTKVTNRGFPDFELDELLTPKLVSEADIEKLFQSALRLIDVDESGDGDTPDTIH
ncbi:MAG TPA: hypothetical protein VHP80_01405 [Candidatus Acidoferrum sp.]|nr:hypothetical protein [Candidatus Acidoferrum sp.]